MNERGELTNLVRSGIIPSKVVTHFKIADRYVQIKKVRKRDTQGIIIGQLSCEFNVSTMTVYRALKIMQV